MIEKASGSVTNDHSEAYMLPGAEIQLELKLSIDQGDSKSANVHIIFSSKAILW